MTPQDKDARESHEVNQLLLFTVLKRDTRRVLLDRREFRRIAQEAPAEGEQAPAEGEQDPPQWPFRETTYIEISEPVTGHPGGPDLTLHGFIIYTGTGNRPAVAAVSEGSRTGAKEITGDLPGNWGEDQAGNCSGRWPLT